MFKSKPVILTFTFIAFRLLIRSSKSFCLFLSHFFYLLPYTVSLFCAILLTIHVSCFQTFEKREELT